MSDDWEDLAIDDFHDFHFCRDSSVSLNSEVLGILMADSLSEESNKNETISFNSDEAKSISNFSSVTNTKKRQKSGSVDALSEVINNVRLQPCMKELFGLYGIRCLDDLHFVKDNWVETVDKIEEMVRVNGFRYRVDLSSYAGQIQYLGRQLRSDGLKYFNFSPMDRIKLVERLPKALEEYGLELTQQNMIRFTSQNQSISGNNILSTLNALEKAELWVMNLTST